MFLFDNTINTGGSSQQKLYFISQKNKIQKEIRFILSERVNKAQSKYNLLSSTLASVVPRQQHRSGRHNNILASTTF